MNFAGASFWWMHLLSMMIDLATWKYQRLAHENVSLVGCTYSTDDRYKADIELLASHTDIIASRTIEWLSQPPSFGVDKEMGERREHELVTRFWANMMTTLNRQLGKQFNTFVHQGALRPVLLLQKELADLKKHINETTAGVVFYNESLELLEKQKQAPSRLESQVRQNPNLAVAVEADIVRIETSVESTSQQLNALKTYFSQKFKK